MLEASFVAAVIEGLEGALDEVVRLAALRSEYASTHLAGVGAPVETPDQKPSFKRLSI